MSKSSSAVSASIGLVNADLEAVCSTDRGDVVTPFRPASSLEFTEFTVDGSTFRLFFFGSLLSPFSFLFDLLLGGGTDRLESYRTELSEELSGLFNHGFLSFNCSDPPPLARFSFNSLIMSPRERFVDVGADNVEAFSANTSSRASSSCLDEVDVRDGLCFARGVQNQVP